MAVVMNDRCARCGKFTSKLSKCDLCDWYYCSSCMFVDESDLKVCIACARENRNHAYLAF